MAGKLIGIIWDGITVVAPGAPAPGAAEAPETSIGAATDIWLVTPLAVTGATGIAACTCGIPG